MENKLFITGYRNKKDIIKPIHNALKRGEKLITSAHRTIFSLLRKTFH